MTYREEVLRTANMKFKDVRYKFVMGALGLTGEAGEVADLFKKYLYHGTPFDKSAVLKELGDLRWYIEYLLISLDSSMEEIEKLNIEKLHKRYPEGFNQKDANERKDEKTTS